MSGRGKGKAGPSAVKRGGKYHPKKRTAVSNDPPDGSTEPTAKKRNLESLPQNEMLLSIQQLLQTQNTLIQKMDQIVNKLSSPTSTASSNQVLTIDDSPPFDTNPPSIPGTTSNQEELTSQQTSINNLSFVPEQAMGDQFRETVNGNYINNTVPVGAFIKQNVKMSIANGEFIDFKDMLKKNDPKDGN